MGRSCPLQSAQPFGAKVKLKILISDRYGVATSCSPYRWLTLTRVYPEEGENETDAQIRLEIAMRLASSLGSNRRRRHGVGPGFVLVVDVGSCSQETVVWE